MGKGRSGGGGPRIDPALNQQYYDQAYESGRAGGEFITGVPDEYVQTAQQGYAAGQAQYQSDQQLAEFERQQEERRQRDEEARQRREAEAAEAAEAARVDAAESAAQAERDRRERERVQRGQARRSEAYNTYLGAVGRAEQSLAAEMARQESNARLLGMDFNISEEYRQQRLEDIFASEYTEEQEATFQQLIDEFGSPEGFEGFMRRGDPERAGLTRREPRTVSATGAPRRMFELLEEEDEILGAQALLG